MIKPTKHIPPNQSIIFLAGYIRNILDRSMSIDDIANVLDNDPKYKTVSSSVNDIILALDILFCIKEISITRDGLLEVRRKNETN